MAILLCDILSAVLDDSWDEKMKMLFVLSLDLPIDIPHYTPWELILDVSC
ncbi:MAG: hypothetical protein ABIK61_04400 [candidate division WOR-3 bacterium]